jgi:hypothetical protein
MLAGAVFCGFAAAARPLLVHWRHGPDDARREDFATDTMIVLVAVLAFGAGRLL